jgi:hypothetical protein
MSGLSCGLQLFEFPHDLETVAEAGLLWMFGASLKLEQFGQSCESVCAGGL